MQIDNSIFEISGYNRRTYLIDTILAIRLSGNHKFNFKKKMFCSNIFTKKNMRTFVRYILICQKHISEKDTVWDIRYAKYLMHSCTYRRICVKYIVVYTHICIYYVPLSLLLLSLYMICRYVMPTGARNMGLKVTASTALCNFYCYHSQSIL